MKKLFFLTALLCASVMGWADDPTAYCEELSPNANFTFSLMNVEDNTYRIQLDAIGDVKFGDSPYNNNCGVHQTTGGDIAFGNTGWTITEDRAYKDFTTSSVESFPTSFWGNYFCFNKKGGGLIEITNFNPTNVDWTATCTSGSELPSSSLTLNHYAVTLDASSHETDAIIASAAAGYDGTITYTTNNANIASVTNAGVVTALGRGSAIITVTAPATESFSASSKKLYVTVTGPINWSPIGWVSGSDEKYKMVVEPTTGVTIDAVQTKDGKKGIYVIFPNDLWGDCSLTASSYATQGAARWYFLSAFEAKETTFTQVCNGVTYTFDVYNKDGRDVIEIYDTNFALASNGATVVASHTQGDNVASRAIDGDNGTNWESTHGVDAVTLTIDMGKRRIFNTIQLLWEGAYGKQFTIDVSDNKTAWRTIKTVNETLSGFPHEQTLELAENDTARYIRFNGIERATQYGYNLFEFRVLLPGVSVLTSIDLTSASNIAKIGEGVALTVQPKDQNDSQMEAEIEYEITPAAAGSVVAGKFMPAQIGAASIVAYSGDVRSSAVNVYGVVSDNLALSTNISTDNKIVAQSEYSPKGTNAFFAVDGNDGSTWQSSSTDGTADADEARTFDGWFVVDLGDFYNIDLITIHFEGACSQLYHVDFSNDNSTWNEAYNYVGSAGVNNHTDYLDTELANNQKVRYVRFWSTKAATQWGMKIYEFQVYGPEWVPTAVDNTIVGEKVVKVIENGQLVIIKNGVKYNVAGQQVK